MNILKILGVSVLGTLLPLLSFAQDQNSVGIGLFTGMEYSPREKTNQLHLGLEYDKKFAQGNGVVGISMSGKRQVLRQETDSTSSMRKFFVLQGMTGFAINEERSKTFAGPIVLIGGGVCWDNWKLEESFPLIFSIALQLNVNFANELGNGDERFGVGVFIRWSYENFYYKDEDEVNKDLRSRVNPMIPFRAGFRLSLKGSK